MPYTQAKTAKGHFRPWEYKYDVVTDTLICPHEKTLRHTTTDRDGKRIYRSTPSECRSCPRREECGANEKGQKMVQRHIWSEWNYRISENADISTVCWQSARGFYSKNSK